MSMHLELAKLMNRLPGVLPQVNSFSFCGCSDKHHDMNAWGFSAWRHTSLSIQNHIRSTPVFKAIASRYQGMAHHAKGFILKGYDQQRRPVSTGWPILNPVSVIIFPNRDSWPRKDFAVTAQWFILKGTINNGPAILSWAHFFLSILLFYRPHCPHSNFRRSGLLCISLIFINGIPCGFCFPSF